MQEPPSIEHVIFFNLTTYEWVYLVLILVQTIFLIKYARETVKLRRTADAQLMIIERQTETMRTQNETLSKQLAASIEEIDRNRKYEIAKITPLFDLGTTFTSGAKRGIRIEDVKGKIKWDEIRANVPWQNSSTGTPMLCGRTIEVPEHVETIYIGKHQIEQSMDFYKLPPAR
jgi:hypothetical protein